MKEKLYTIPVNNAFSKDCECPLCKMYSELENNSIEYTLGPSYMEEYIRNETNKNGFCNHHIKLLFNMQNTLGLANILKTHLYNKIKDIEDLSKQAINKKGLFRKNSLPSISKYIDKHNQSCFICNRIETTFTRYISTIIHLYKADTEFRKKFTSSKGFCLKHYNLLYLQGTDALNGNVLESFIEDLNKVTIDNLKRVDKDLDWYIDKFDYRYKDEPWKNSKDAIERTITKTNSILINKTTK